jgi:two-component system, cell cycle response regulator
MVLSAIATQPNAVDGTTARLGGEEFCVLRECDLTDATEMAEALRQSMRRLRFKDHRGLSVTCSFGVAEWESGDTIDLLRRRADVALYEAKTTGRDRVIASDSFPRTEHHDAWRGVARTARRARS